MKHRGHPPHDSGNRGRRLGREARGSMEFLLLCMKRGVPPEKISSFLLGLGIDAHTVNRWMDHLRREMAGVPERTPLGNDRPKAVERPAGTEQPKAPQAGGPITLEGGTATDFVLPDLDATKTALREKIKNDTIMEEETINVSLEISAKELQRAQEVPIPSRPQKNELPVSMLVSSPPAEEFSEGHERVQLEKPRSSGKKRRKSRSSERKWLATPQARLGAFAAAILVTWLLSDAGWFPGGSARHAAMPASDVVAKEEPVLSAPKPADPPVADQAAPLNAPPAQNAAVVQYPDPWAPKAAQPPSDRAPGSAKPVFHRTKRPKRRPSSD